MKPCCRPCASARRFCQWPEFLVVRPRSLLPALSWAHVQDLLLLIPRTAPGIEIREYISVDGLHMTLSISHRMTSYIHQLPARLGHNEALDKAVASVAAALRWRHTTKTEDQAFTPTTLSLYGQALQLLQHALDDAEISSSPEVLCATELLCIFEVGDFFSVPDVVAKTYAIGTCWKRKSGIYSARRWCSQAYPTPWRGTICERL